MVSASSLGMTGSVVSSRSVPSLVPALAQARPEKQARGIGPDDRAGDVSVRGAGGRSLPAAEAVAAAPGGRTCACGSCPACAARVYAGVQAGGSAGGPGSPARPEGGEEADLASGKRRSGERGEEQEAAREGDDRGEREEGAKSGGELSPTERSKVAQLKRIDREIRAHERAHLAAAGPYARSGVRLGYASGPDGERYAVRGEVAIDTSSESTPEKTIAKMRMVRRAALAPARPSAQDRRVAAAAASKMTRAYEDLRKLQEAEAAADRAGARRPGNGISLTV